AGARPGALLSQCGAPALLDWPRCMGEAPMPSTPTVDSSAHCPAPHTMPSPSARPDRCAPRAASPAGVPSRHVPGMLLALLLAACAPVQLRTPAGEPVPWHAYDVAALQAAMASGQVDAAALVAHYRTRIENIDDA